MLIAQSVVEEQRMPQSRSGSRRDQVCYKVPILKENLRGSRLNPLDLKHWHILADLLYTIDRRHRAER